MAYRVPTVEELKERMAKAKELETATKGATMPITVEGPKDLLKPAEPKKTLSDAAVSEILALNEIDPLQELLDAYNERDDDGSFVMSRAERTSLMKTLLEYHRPKLKSVEHKGDPVKNQLTIVLAMPDGSCQIKQVEKRGEAIDV